MSSIQIYYICSDSVKKNVLDSGINLDISLHIKYIMKLKMIHISAGEKNRSLTIIFQV